MDMFSVFMIYWRLNDSFMRSISALIWAACSRLCSMRWSRFPTWYARLRKNAAKNATRIIVRNVFISVIQLSFPTPRCRGQGKGLRLQGVDIDALAE